jgi:hypothetical protein
MPGRTLLWLGLSCYLSLAGTAPAASKAVGRQDLQFSFQVVAPHPVKEQAGGKARAISYGKAGKNATVIIHVPVAEGKALADWATAHAGSKTAEMAGVWYVSDATKKLLSREIFWDLKALRAPETHKLADGSGDEYEIVFTYRAKKGVRGPIDPKNPLPR